MNDLQDDHKDGLHHWPHEDCYSCKLQRNAIDFEELAFNAVKARVLIVDFINQFEDSNDRDRARHEFKRAEAILRETLPHLFKS